MTTKQIVGVLITVLVVAGIFSATIYINKPVAPVVGADGKVSGEYSIADIMELKKPYRCAFKRNDGESQIKGLLSTDGQKIYGEFRILSPGLSDKEFNSFILIKDGSTFAWTSLAPIGYKSGVAKSALKNASPVEQAQIVGTRDKFDYECEPWQNSDQSVFDEPSWITFSTPK